MKTPTLDLHLDHPQHHYRPGQVLSGTYHWTDPSLEEAHANEVTALEISVLWFTEGKGDEELAVHFFERRTLQEAAAHQGLHTGHFQTVLPATPLSYEGVIVKIRWCARVRLYLARGREVMAEAPFRLGLVPPARAVLK